MFNENVESFKIRLKSRGYPDDGFEKHIAEVTFQREIKVAQKQSQTQDHTDEEMTA